MDIKKKIIFYWDGIVEGDIVERLQLNRFSKHIFVLVVVILIFIAMGMSFQQALVHQNESKKKMEEAAILYNETLYNKEKSESLNAIMTKLDEVNSTLSFPKKPAVILAKEATK